MEATLLSRVPEWVAIRFLPSSTFSAWNDARFEHEFNSRQKRIHGISHGHTSMQLSGGGNGRSDLVRLRDTLKSESNNLEPVDEGAVAYGVKRASSNSLRGVACAQNTLEWGRSSASFSTNYENTLLGDVGPPGAYQKGNLGITLSDLECPPRSESSGSSGLTSSTAHTSTTHLNEEALPWKKLPKVGSIVDHDNINLSLRFEYLENPQRFCQKYHNHKEIISTFSVRLQNIDEDHEAVDEIIDTEPNLAAQNDENSESDETSCASEQQENQIEAITKSGHYPEGAVKHVFAYSTLLDTDDYSAPRRPNDLYGIGNNFVGIDRYRMSAVLTREERLEKLVFASGEILVLSAQYFHQGLQDPEATIPGHEDIQIADLVEFKRSSPTKGPCQSASVKVNRNGCVVQIGFPGHSKAGDSKQLSGEPANLLGMRESCMASGQLMHQFGLGVFRIDAPAASTIEGKPASTNAPSMMANAVGESAPSVFPKDQSTPKEMPWLIADENNRFWPSQRALAAIPDGHFLAPNRTNGFRGLRLERDPQHPRWQHRFQPDPSILYGSGPPVAVRRRSGQSAPAPRARSPSPQSCSESESESESESKSGSWSKIEQEDKECKPKTLDGAVDKEVDEEGVACGEPDPDAMVEIVEPEYEFPKLEFEWEGIEIGELKPEFPVVEKKLKGAALKPARFDPLRQPRPVRRVRFQL